ncbi:MAG: serine/threonine protein kinase, bacterial [Pyrinomonadaceae bacterium]|jgi:serine/threonine protein kinase|nr:serine/threonine protein kinase, bacterial [Pyrinomonadaceae bacterium]
MSSDEYCGKVLDEKYRLERLLGQGGMGAVYLAVHLGTERYVALKLITPQFMRNEEFVQRFKREARAAGRLRHPNVVDVTDFGFARVRGENVAYLVMEYLDGCTLGDVLKEETRLPLEWVVDILEQVSSAVHEAHQQGIVHRDLKPENIWLEPNRLGGYRVKVLDFGIAKLAEVDNSPAPAKNLSGKIMAVTAPAATEDLEIDTLVFASENPDLTQARSAAATSSPASNNDDTRMFGSSATATDLESASTAILSPTIQSAGPDHRASNATGMVDDDRTQIFNGEGRQTSAGQPTTAGGNVTRATQLTQVGAIMGTPIYMSPEQCRGKTLDARSDIYSLGVIAYQMLAGEPPFAGPTDAVMRGHREMAPPPLRDRAKKVPKRVAQTVAAALAKDPAARPQTAAAFASALRAQADGISALYRRAFALYSEYFPKFLKMSFLAHSPVIITTVVMIILQLALDAQPKGITFAKVCLVVSLALVALVHIAGYFVAASAIAGMTAVIVTQLQAAPLRPVELRTAFGVLKKRWKPFLKTSLGVTLRIIIGTVLLVIPGVVMQLRYAFYAPVVLVEGLEKKAARQRSYQLASRSWRTMIIVWFLQFLIPISVSLLIGNIHIGAKQAAAPTQGFHTQEIYKQLASLVNIVVVPLVAIVSALLYLKMRQLGGETLSSALSQIEEVDSRLTNWQQRMRTRLSVNTPRSTAAAIGQQQTVDSKE